MASGKVQVDSLSNNYMTKIPSNAKIYIQPAVGQSYDPYGGLYYHKFSYLVHVHVGLQGLTPNTALTVGLLPEGFRPSSDVCSACNGGASVNAYARIQITGGGNIRVSSADQYILGDILFFAFG